MVIWYSRPRKLIQGTPATLGIFLGQRMDRKKRIIFSALGVRHGFDSLGFCFYHNLYQAHGFSLLKYRSPYSLTSIPVWFGMNFAVIISWCFSLASKTTLKRKAWGTGYPFHSFWMGMREKQERKPEKLAPCRNVRDCTELYFCGT